MVTVFVVVSNRGRRPRHYFSDTELYLRVRNIGRAPIQSICCTGKLTPRLVTLRVQTGQGYCGGACVWYGSVVFVAALWS